MCRIVRAPGLSLQHLTTKEPTLDMLEVAIASFEMALHPPKGDLIFTEPVREESENSAGAEPEAETKPEETAE